MKFQKNLLNLKIEKKHKYFIYAFLLGLFVFLFSYGNEDYKSAFAALAIFVSIFGVFFTQYPNVRLTNILVHLILPFHLTVGVLMSLIYFPNLSLLLRFGFICFYIFSLYILSLVNNVFLVVEDRRESIPLFRVALTWIQILIVLIAIPFFAGIFKLEINSLFQNIIVGFSSALFVSYLFWVFSMEKDFKTLAAGERYTLFFMTFFSVFASGMAVSFIPSESFLRAIFVSSILMFCVNYIYGHLRNNLNKNLILQHFFISLVFLIIIILFNP